MGRKESDTTARLHFHFQLLKSGNLLNQSLQSLQRTTTPSGETFSPVTSKPKENYNSQNSRFCPFASLRPAPPLWLQRLHFPETPGRVGDGTHRAPPGGALLRGLSSRRPSRRVPGVRAVRDGGLCVLRCVRCRDARDGARRPRPLRRGAPRVPETGCAAA